MNACVRTGLKSLPVSLALVLVVASTAAWADETIDRTLDMPADGLVKVENLAGHIEFTTWDREQVQVRGEASDDVEEVEITSTSRSVEVRVRNKKGERRIDGTDLRLVIPEQASIEASGVSADIKITGSRGQSISLNTVSGDLEVAASTQRLELQSVSGDIEFEGETPRSNFETVSGEIVIVGATGEVSANTVSGDLSLDTNELTRGRFEAVSGDLTLAMSLADEGRLTCDSMSGDVMLRLPGDQEAEFTAQSFSGSIRTDFGESSRVSKGPGVVLEHREGDNGAQIRLESFSGDISIRRQ
jgi:DUF4097 and DUF4098 domain-containing protein YvlB